MQRNLNHVHAYCSLEISQGISRADNNSKGVATCLLKPLFNYDACRCTNCSSTSFMNDKGVG